MPVIYDYIAGALGGMVGLLIGHPLDTLKVTLQVKNRSSNGTIIGHLKNVAASGMKNGFYRGLAFPLCSATLQSSVFFGTYGLAISLIGRPPSSQGSPEDATKIPRTDRVPSYAQAYLAGCFGGMVQSVFFCPSDRIKVVLQSQIGNLGTASGIAPSRGKIPAISALKPSATESQVKYFYGPREAVACLYKRYGLRRTFYRGYSALLLRDTNGFGVYIFCNEVVKDFALSRLGSGRRSEIASSVIAGGLAGSISWFCCMPFDVVKNVFQSDLSHEHRSVWSCARSLYRRHGVRIFFRGSSVICLQALPVNGAIFLTYTESLKAFRHFHSTVSDDRR